MQKNPSSQQTSEALFRGLFDNMTCGCAIYDVIGDGSQGNDYIVKNFNKASSRLEGKTVAEVVGKSLYELRPNIDDYGLIPVLKKVWETGIPDFYPVRIYQDNNFSNYYENYIFKLPSGEVVTIYNDVTEQKRAEEALRESEERFRALSMNTPDHVIIQDKELRYVWVINPPSGLSEEDMLGKTDFDILPKEDAGNLTRLKKRVLETGNTEYPKLQMVTKTGVLRYFEGACLPRHNAEGEIDGLFGYFRDVTDKIEDEKARRQSEARLCTLVDTIPDLVWLKDMEGVYLSCNPTFERFFGAKESEIVGKTDYDFKDKDLADFFREHDRKAMDADGPSVNEEWLTFADNGYHGLFETIKNPMRDADDNLIGVLGIARDITQRKDAEEALKENEQRYKKAQRLGQVGNWEFDSVTEKFWGSDEAKRIYGFDPESTDFTVTEIESCIPEREIVHQALVDLLEKNEPYNLEFEIRPRIGGDRKIIKSIAEVIRDDSGAPLKVAGVIQDITQQKNAEKEKILLERQLRQSQKLESIGLLAGGIAHDFNNILSAIIGFTELALDEVERGARLEDDLQEVLTAGKRAKELVRQILAFARQSDEEIKPVRIDAIAREAFQLMRSTIPATIEIQQELNSDSLVMGNPAQIHQIFMNLCTNAVHAMEGAGGILRVGLEDVRLDKNVTLKNKKLEPGDYLKIDVSDTGKGIAPGILDSIFDPYFTTKGPGEGSGLGLAVVHGIIEGYGGMITVSSELNKGARFTIYLPVTRNRQNAEHTEKNPTGTERILFVDDELPIAKMGQQILEQLGYSVTMRTSSVEALELFQAKPDEFDLIITDMTMPNLTGDKLAIELMKIRSAIPVILCTGFSKSISSESAAEIGIRAFVYKPVGRADFAKIVRSVLDESKRLNQK